MEKSKSCQDNVYFSGEKFLSCEKLNMKKKSRKNVLYHDWINWKKHFQEKIMEKPSGKKRYQGKKCFYHVWKKWKNVRGYIKVECEKLWKHFKKKMYSQGEKVYHVRNQIQNLLTYVNKQTKNPGKTLFIMEKPSKIFPEILYFFCSCYCLINYFPHPSDCVPLFKHTLFGCAVVPVSII